MARRRISYTLFSGVVVIKTLWTRQNISNTCVCFFSLWQHLPQTCGHCLLPCRWVASRSRPNLSLAHWHFILAGSPDPHHSLLLLLLLPVSRLSLLQGKCDLWQGPKWRCHSVNLQRLSVVYRMESRLSRRGLKAVSKLTPGCPSAPSHSHSLWLPLVRQPQQICHISCPIPAFPVTIPLTYEAPSL